VALQWRKQEKLRKLNKDFKIVNLTADPCKDEQDAAVAELANGCSEREAFYFGAKKLGVNA
jgi:cytochrome oxidase Cu insertion factor (SCO1/SenC/PrrC family)